MDERITTVDGRLWTGADSRALARLVWLRYGRDMAGAAAAWRRLLQNDCSAEAFAELVTEAPPGLDHARRRWQPTGPRAAVAPQTRIYGADASRQRAQARAAELGLRAVHVSDLTDEEVRRVRSEHGLDPWFRYSGVLFDWVVL